MKVSEILEKLLVRAKRQLSLARCVPSDFIAELFAEGLERGLNEMLSWTKEHKPTEVDFDAFDRNRMTFMATFHALTVLRSLWWQEKRAFEDLVLTATWFEWDIITSVSPYYAHFAFGLPQSACEEFESSFLVPANPIAKAYVVAWSFIAATPFPVDDHQLSIQLAARGLPPTADASTLDPFARKRLVHVFGGYDVDATSLQLLKLELESTESIYDVVRERHCVSNKIAKIDGKYYVAGDRDTYVNVLAGMFRPIPPVRRPTAAPAPAPVSRPAVPQPAVSQQSNRHKKKLCQ